MPNAQHGPSASQLPTWSLRVLHPLAAHSTCPLPQQLWAGPGDTTALETFSSLIVDSHWIGPECEHPTSGILRTGTSPLCLPYLDLMEPP